MSRRPTVLGPATILAAFLGAAAAPSLPSSPAEEFFIVSSVDAGKNTIVLKRPTETTLSMRVTERTRCRSEKGEPIAVAALRAGDTVFIVVEPAASGPPTARSVRRGPMTVEELHRRYLRF